MTLIKQYFYYYIVLLFYYIATGVVHQLASGIKSYYVCVVDSALLNEGDMYIAICEAILHHSRSGYSVVEIGEPSPFSLWPILIFCLIIKAAMLFATTTRRT